MHIKRPVNFQRPAKAVPNRWYDIVDKLQAKDGEGGEFYAEVNIYDEIGMWGVTASDFVKDLTGVGSAEIRLHINSPGGDVFEGLAILTALRQHPAKVTVSVDGVAASAASFIAMAGDEIVMAPNAMMMIHDASGMVYGNADDLTQMADLLDKASQNIATIYAERAGGDADKWRAAMKIETWYTDQEAVDAGLADSIMGATKVSDVITDEWAGFDFAAVSASISQALKGA